MQENSVARWLEHWPRIAVKDQVFENSTVIKGYSAPQRSFTLATEVAGRFKCVLSLTILASPLVEEVLVAREGLFVFDSEHPEQLLVEAARSVGELTATELRSLENSLRNLQDPDLRELCARYMVHAANKWSIIGLDPDQLERHFRAHQRGTKRGKRLRTTPTGACAA